MNYVMFKPKYLLLGVEDNEGAGAVLPATSVLRTSGLAVNVGINGNVETFEFDAANDADELNKPESVTGQQNQVKFSTPFAYPTIPGTPGALDDLLRICGFNPFFDGANKVTRYKPAELDGIDSGHFAMRADRSENNEVSYESKGVRGTFDFLFEVNKKMLLNNIELVGGYIRPMQRGLLEPNQQTALQNLGAALTVNSLAVLVDGKPVCVEKLELKNVGGLEFNKLTDSCEDAGVFATRVNPSGELVYSVPDFDADFNPFEIGELEIAKRAVLIVRLNSANLGAFKLRVDVQFGMPKRVELSGKNTGYSQSFKCLNLPNFEMTEAVDFASHTDLQDVLQAMRAANAAYSINCDFGECYGG